MLFSFSRSTIFTFAPLSFNARCRPENTDAILGNGEWRGHGRIIQMPGRRATYRSLTATRELSFFHTAVWEPSLAVDPGSTSK